MYTHYVQQYLVNKQQCICIDVYFIKFDVDHIDKNAFYTPAMACIYKMDKRWNDSNAFVWDVPLV